jgi:hypothetical protein
MEGARPPFGARMIAVVNAVAALLTVAFWVLVYVRVFAPGRAADAVARASSAATLGFLVGDVAWAVPLLVLSAAGLWRGRAWGWLLGQLVNVLWVYSLTVIWVRDVYSGVLSPGAVLFTPFALFAAGAAAYLWFVRDEFDVDRRPDRAGAAGER